MNNEGPHPFSMCVALSLLGLQAAIGLLLMSLQDEGIIMFGLVFGMLSIIWLPMAPFFNPLFVRDSKLKRMEVKK